MNKAMFSGVAGLKTHQSKMDVIGNNIANVNTYGFKANRAVFSDVYYQTIKGATGGTASSGGTNPSSIGYGSMLAGVQTQMTTSSIQTTGYGLDVAIAGEGFIQVMDPDGNIFYTKAGMLDYDSNGYLTDINGNFVLGASGATDDPNSLKIKLDDIGSVDAARPSVEMTINGIEYTVTGSNATSYGNVSMTITSSEALPSGLKASASISATGSITVSLNAFEDFASMDDVNAAINAAILEANGGVEHAAGTFTITASENVFGSDAVSASASGAVTQESASVTGTSLFGGKVSASSFSPGTGTTYGDGDPVSYEITESSGNYVIKTTIGSETFTATVSVPQGAGNTLTLTGDNGGTLTLSVDSQLEASDITAVIGTGVGGTASVNSGNAYEPTYFLGGATFTSVSSVFPYTSGITITSVADASPDITVTAQVGGVTYTGTVPAAGGAVTFSSGNDADGTFVMTFPSQTEMTSNLSLASPASVSDIATAMGLTSGEHTLKISKSTEAVAESLTGAQIVGTAGGIDKGGLEGSAVDDGLFGGIITIKDVSSTFSGDGTIDGNTFYATYYEAGTTTKLDGTATTEDSWVITMMVDGVEYRSVLQDGEQAGTLLLQSTGDSTDYIEISNPGFSAMTTAYKNENSGAEPNYGQTINAVGAGETITAVPSVASSNLGFGTSSFVLTGGTEGGAVTLDQIQNIAIGSDGTIVVSHAEKGTVVCGKISLAVFANSMGLQLTGSNYYTSTLNSGEAILVDPGTGGSGGLVASALEMSNVDISNEFAEMITCQRGFQANSRIITVSDTMLEELINLKR